MIHSDIPALLDRSPALAVGFVVLIVLSAAVTVWALVTAVRTPEERLTLPRVAWIIVILLVWAPVGGIAFLVGGRRKGTATGTVRQWKLGSRAGIEALYDEP